MRSFENLAGGNLLAQQVDLHSFESDDYRFDKTIFVELNFIDDSGK